ncbi:myelocytomatosis oncogene homolog [Salarias fasciatus]|uniref:Transcriptional regulator Myc-2-like n=1 Tax=Salarias fasciatus TaxID=181472 RepID=A0A672HMP4_SALFA|nr:transcriptional regulator Myc-2-like [Salarias fasciatus]XP_029947899.1 transcriptional regulator Myc-2-like [Salarias fasciatus]
MLQSFGHSQQDWFCSEPLLFDDDFCQSLMKDLQSLPTPPQSPPMKAGPGTGNPLSKEDQLSYVSDLLLEDHDMQLNWKNDFFPVDTAEKEGGEAGSQPCSPLEEACADSLWQCLTAGKMLGSSPLLSDIDTSIFEEIAGSTLDCQNLMDTQEPSEATSDYGSAGGELSTYSSSDSEEEIDVVTVVRCPSSPSPPPSLAERSARQQKQEEEQRALQRYRFEIHLQHNYAAPRPASPPPASNKRTRGSDGSSRFHHSSRSSSSSSSSSSRYHGHHHHHHHHSSRSSTETEDEEERRRTHNVMERQRRNELKNCFMRLRDNVPELTHNDKASKVLILKKARDCIFDLEDQGHRLQSKRDKLKARQEVLKARLQQLRS